MRKRTLEHIFKHTLLFIAILLPLIIAFSALFCPVEPVSYEKLHYTSDDVIDTTFFSAPNYRAYSFMLNLITFFDSCGLAPFRYHGIDLDYGYPIIESEGFNSITYGIFQVMGYLMGDVNQAEVLNNLVFIDYTDWGIYDVASNHIPAMPWGSAYVLCEYLGYIFFVYVFYFLIELFLFVPRLGVDLGDRIMRSGHGKGGEIEW